MGYACQLQPDYEMQTCFIACLLASPQFTGITEITLNNFIRCGSIFIDLLLQQFSTSLCCGVLAHLVSDGIRLVGQDLDWWAGNGLSILHVEAANLLQLTIVLAIVRQKLGHHSHWFQGIDGEARTFPIEAAVSVPEGVDVAAIFVAKTLVALILVIVTTLNAFTHVLPLSRNVAWVRGIGSCHVVGLPNIHLGTAGAIVTKAHAVAEILWVWLPVL